MWLLLPVMAAGLLLLAILVALIYLLIYLPPLIPRYTYQAQRLTYRVEAIAKRIAEIARKPLLLVQELSSLIKSYLANR